MGGGSGGLERRLWRGRRGRFRLGLEGRLRRVCAGLGGIRGCRLGRRLCLLLEGRRRPCWVLVRRFEGEKGLLVTLYVASEALVGVS